MTKVGWEKSWLTRDLAGGFDWLRPDGPRKTPWALRNLFQNRVYVQSISKKTWAQSHLAIEMGWGQPANISHWEWHAKLLGVAREGRQEESSFPS